MTSSRLSASQIAAFEQDGYLSFDPVFSGPEVQDLADAYDDCLERLRNEENLKNIRQGHLTDGTPTQVNQISGSGIGASCEPGILPLGA